MKGVAQHRYRQGILSVINIKDEELSQNQEGMLIELCCLRLCRKMTFIFTNKTAPKSYHEHDLEFSPSFASISTLNSQERAALKITVKLIHDVMLIKKLTVSSSTM